MRPTMHGVPGLARDDWGVLFARYERMAIAMARGITGDGELARDLFQEAARATFERATTGAVDIASPEHGRNYLFAALRNLAIDARARGPRVPAGLVADPVDPVGPGPLDGLVARESTARRGERLRTAFAALPSREQEVLDLRYLRGLKYKEIADLTGLSISTLQARVEAGLGRLRRDIGKPAGAE